MTNPTDNTRPRLRRSAVPGYLQAQFGIDVAVQTLAAWAVRGRGPRFQKDGNNVLYPVDELDLWAAQRLSPIVSNTAELAALKA